MRINAARARSTLASSTIVMPVSASASGTLGVSKAARGSMCWMNAPMASGSSKRAPPLATITGSITMGPSNRASSAATASISGAVPSMPVFTTSAPISSSTTRICWRTKSGGTGCTPCTPSVFCAVRAVMAVAA